MTFQNITISSSTILRTILILLAFWFLYLIRDILLILFAAVVLAWAIEPVAARAARYRIPRVVTVVGVYGAVIVLLSVIVTLLIPPVTEQVRSLAQALPGVVAPLQTWLRLPGVDQEIVGQAQQVLNRVGNSLGNLGLGLVQQTRSILSTAVSIIFIFVITFYLVIEKDPLKKMCRLLLPKEHIPYVNQILEKAQRQVGRWVVAQLTLGIIVGGVVGLGLWLLGVPYALVLGIIAGILEIVPAIGPVVAAIPGVIIAATHGWVLGVAALVFYWIVQQLENHLLVPNIMKRAIGLNPLVTLIAVLLGARLVGIAGVILAVPAATILSVFLADVFASDEDLAG